MPRIIRLRGWLADGGPKFVLIAFALREVWRMNEENAEDFRAEAEAGDDYAQLLLAECYANGKGVAKDAGEAAKWWLKSAWQGCPAAQGMTGKCYEEGTGVEKNEAEAWRWYLKAAMQWGDEGCIHLGEFDEYTPLFKYGDTDAEEVLGPALHGNAEMQFRMGEKCFVGSGGPVDEAAAVGWYLRAAEQAHVEAEYSLAHCYRHGVGISADEALAATWYLKAAQRGFRFAQLNIAECLAEGKGVDRDDAGAFTWFLQAAKRGCAYAQLEVAERYHSGRGVPMGCTQALLWARIAIGAPFMGSDWIKNTVATNWEQRVGLMGIQKEFGEVRGLPVMLYDELRRRINQPVPDNGHIHLAPDWHTDRARILIKELIDQIPPNEASEVLRWAEDLGSRTGSE